VSNKAKTAMKQEIRAWRFQMQTSMSMKDLAQKYNAVIRGWINYYGRFYKTDGRCAESHQLGTTTVGAKEVQTPC